MVKVFDWSEVHSLAGRFSHECALELMKAGTRGKKSTSSAFAAHKACIRKKFEDEARKRISGLA